MNANFLTILFCLTIISGLIALVDRLFWRPARQSAGITKLPKIVEYAISFFPVFLLVLVIRSFILQLFVVPTGSLEPTIMPRAYILVNQFAYGLRLPVTETKIIPIGEPQRGDIVLFHSPVVPNMDLIKRVVGVPGDHISYVNKVFFINGQEAKQRFVGYTTDGNGDNSPRWTVKILEEDLLGVKHLIYVCDSQTMGCPSSGNQDFRDLVVPPGQYLMIGDNRDNSDDSRYWGFVPEKNIMGQGARVILSWDSDLGHPRWAETWKKL